MAGDGLDREAVRRRALAATPGPWEMEVQDGSEWYFAGEEAVVLAGPGEAWERDAVSVMGIEDGNAADAEFIAHARTDVPALLDALRAAEERLRAVEAAAWAAVRAQMPGSDDDARCDALLHLEGVLRTEGGAS